MGGFWELGSFVTRSLSTRDQQSSGLAMIAQLLLLLAPLWVNAFCYMVLGRMVQFFIPTHAIFRIRASTLAMYFVGLDIVSFIIQLVGGGMAGNGQPPETIKKGIDIYMGGIGLQEFFIIVFLAFAIKFHLQMLAMEKRGELVGTGKEKWRILLYALYTSLLLISVRIIFRLIEFSRGNKPDNPIPYNEKYLYFLDVLPMFLAIAVMNVAHPGRFLIGPESELPKANWRKKRALRKNAKKRLIDDEYEEMVTRVPVDAQGNKRPT
ncbi:MAG: hypothetical protein M1837_006345 [Sclerophora amabilis]|nr:MAG: hypothetical protein M1837_006345 [Sclerophora amabilis]